MSELIFLKNMNQPYFSKMSKVAKVTEVSKTLGQWFVNGKKVKIPPPEAIRWHTLLKYPHPTLNSREATMLANFKRNQRAVLRDCEVRTPKTWFDKNFVDSFPVLCRPQRHARGSKFFLANNMKELMSVNSTSSWYFSQWIEKEDEWRVYVGGGKVLTAFQKPIKGHLRGHIRETGMWGDLKMPPKEICDLSIAGTDALGLDFGGVDVISDKDRHYIVEINSAPMFLSIELANIFKNYFVNV